MRVSTNQLYDRSAALMSSLTQSAGKLQTQVATGKKLVDASDDPTAYSRLSMLKQAATDSTTYQANVSLAQTLVQQSDTTLGNIQTQLTRVQELAVQANSGTLSDTNRTAISTELNSILDQLVSLANTSDARGQPLFGGNSATSGVTRASDGTVTITGTGTPAAIPVGSGESIQATDSAAKVFGGITTTSGATSDMFAIVQSLSAAVSSGTGIANAAKDVDIAAARINTAHASIGARGARLDIISDQLSTTSTDREALRTTLEDADMPTAIAELQKTMTILSATQASFTKLSSLSLFDYLR